MKALSKACKCFSTNPAQVNDLNGVASSSKTGIFARRARVDQAVGLYYRPKRNLTF